MGAAPGAPPAAAAPLLSVSYTVTGGLFNGPGLAGAITGGSVVYAAPSPFLATPQSCTTIGACGSIVTLQLLGPAGGWTLLSPVQVIMIITGPTLAFGFTSGFPNTATVAFHSGISAIYSRPLTTMIFANNTGYIRAGVAATYKHIIFIGNEVRTFVPEPMTATLLGLGLALFGFAGPRIAARRKAQHW